MKSGIGGRGENKPDFVTLQPDQTETPGKPLFLYGMVCTAVLHWESCFSSSFLKNKIFSQFHLTAFSINNVWIFWWCTLSCSTTFQAFFEATWCVSLWLGLHRCCPLVCFYRRLTVPHYFWLGPVARQSMESPWSYWPRNSVVYNLCKTANRCFCTFFFFSAHKK